MVRLRGVHAVRVRRRDSVREYHYAWRGGPRLKGSPGSAEYVSSFEEAHAGRKIGPKGAFKEIITKFKGSPKFSKLGVHTTRAYQKHLDEIERRWGSMPIKGLDDPGIRSLFIEWRDSMADRPRTADMAIGTLKVLLAWANEYVLITTNQAEPISRLHTVDKSDEIWTKADLDAFAKEASDELCWAVELAICTGLRQSDLIRLAWNHEKDGAFVFRTRKRNRVVTVPITPACRALLGRIEKRSTVILTTQRGHRTWTADGLRSSFGKARNEAKVERTFHDLRRTAVTAFIAAGLDNNQVASIVGWSEADVEAMKRTYVSRAAIVSAVLAKLEKGG